MSKARRLKAPWSVCELDSCFLVETANQHRVAYVYFERDPARLHVTGMLTRDEARRVAHNIAKLPQLLKPKGQEPAE